jgi:hypothetical protein
MDRFSKTSAAIAQSSIFEGISGWLDSSFYGIAEWTCPITTVLFAASVVLIIAKANKRRQKERKHIAMLIERAKHNTPLNSHGLKSETLSMCDRTHRLSRYYAFKFLIFALFGVPSAAVGFWFNLRLVWPDVNDISEEGAQLLMALSLPGLVLGALLGGGFGLLVASWYCESGPE